MIFRPGQTINNGQYTIERVLGRGGFATTYLAIDQNQERFAIKNFHHNINNIKLIDQQGVDNFLEDINEFVQNAQEEANRLSNLQHSGIVRYQNFFVESIECPLPESTNSFKLQSPCLVMEYIEGLTLKELCRQRNLCLSENEALEYSRQVGQALTYIHNQNLLHRDISPNNIMVRTNTSNAVLIDFGLAREFTPEATLSHTQLGARGYASPEQLYRSNNRWGAYVDVYGLAATLYYLLTLQRPIGPFCHPINNRNNNPTLIPQNLNNTISNRTNLAIIGGMLFQTTQRPQTIQQWLQSFTPPMTSWDIRRLNNINSIIPEASNIYQESNTEDNFLPVQQLNTNTWFLLYEQRSGSSNSNSTIENNLTFKIQYRYSNLFLGIREARQDPGASALQWDAATDGSQDWWIESQGNGQYHIRNANSGLYLGIREDNQYIIQLNYIEDGSRDWFIIPDRINSGYIRIQNVKNQTYLAIRAYSTNSGEVAYQDTNNNANGQLWVLKCNIAIRSDS